MLSFGANVIIWLMLSSGTKCHHLEQMLSSVSIVIIWCYHVMLSSGMITPPFLFFLETSLTHPCLLLIPFGKSRFKPPNIWDQLFTTTVSCVFCILFGGICILLPWKRTLVQRTSPLSAELRHTPTKSSHIPPLFSFLGHQSFSSILSQRPKPCKISWFYFLYQR